MSVISLQSIRNSGKTDSTDFYVGSVIDSESGFLYPKLVNNISVLDSMFGDFPYKQMYRDLINNDIPVCLLPTITRESEYNLCSLRLSNGIVTVCHPKIGKKYTYMSMSNLFHFEFSKRELISSQYGYSYTVTHNLDFYPRIVVESDGEEIKPIIFYNDKDITITLSEKRNGSVWIESIPQVESDPNFIIVDRFGKLGGGVTPTYEFEVPNKVIPEVVVTIDEGPNKGQKVETNVHIDDSSGKNMVTVSPKLPQFDVRYRIDVRIVPSGALITKNAYSETNIYHNGNRFPLFKFEKGGDESWAHVEYKTINYAVIKVSDVDDTVIRYNIISAKGDFNINLLNTHQTMFNLILDFTDVPYNELVRRGSLTDPSNYLIIDTVNEQCLVASGEWHGVTSNYYNTNAVHYFEEGVGADDREKKNYTLTKFKEWFNDRYSNSCSNYEDQLVSFIKHFIQSNGLPHLDQFGEQVFIDDWKKALIDEAYKWDFWLETNEYSVKILKYILEKYDQYTLVSLSDFISEIKALNLRNEKLLIEYANPIHNLNHYRFDGIRVSDLYNLTQDKLCDLTERNKVVDIFSVAKGSVGKNTCVEINEVRDVEGVYDITVSNGSITENYTVRLYGSEGDYVIDTIFISEINQLSELIRIYFYNYWTNNRLIDSIYYDEELYGEPYNEANLRKIKELKLPTGKFYLDRNVDEVITEESRKNSLKIYAESGWYPDLFLVDSLPNDFSHCRAVLDLVKYNDDTDRSIYSQALIKLNSHQLGNRWFGQDGYPISEENRVLYFYDDISIGGIAYPSYYPYILNIIGQTYLNLPKRDILYEPFRLVPGNSIHIKRYEDIEISGIIEKRVGNYVKVNYLETNRKGESTLKVLHGEIEGDKINILQSSNSNIVTETLNIENDVKGFLNKKHINYLNLDNLKYFYKTLSETPGQRSIFIVQFILSKYTREILQIRNELIGLTRLMVVRKLEYINSKCMRLIPLIVSSELESNFSGNSIQVTYTVLLSTIINKEYKLNFVLDT